MTLLAGTAYDPAAAVSKITTAALAMTALDTTSLRLGFTVPANGSVLVRLEGTITGAATYPQVLLGVMQGSTVIKKAAPRGYLNGVAAATTFLTVETLFVVTGLTPGSALTWDAAYGVEQLVASTAIRYGGPNDATAGTAYGAFCFEVWDTA